MITIVFDYVYGINYNQFLKKHIFHLIVVFLVYFIC
jgi:hypothetical protein